MDFNFKKAREDLGLSINQLSKKSKINSKSIKMLENGEYERLRWKTFIKIVDALDLRIELIDSEK